MSVGERTEMRKEAVQPRAVRILLADDFAEWRLRIRSILSGPEWQIVFEACDGLEAVQKMNELRPDIALLDIGMPRMNGIEAAKKIRRELPDCKIIFVTQHIDEDVLSAAVDAGGESCLLKSKATTDLALAIEDALRDGHRK